MRETGLGYSLVRVVMLEKAANEQYSLMRNLILLEKINKSLHVLIECGLQK